MRRRESNRRVLCGDADNGTVEIIERFFINDGCNFTGQATSAHVLVQQNNFVGFANRVSDRFPVERRNGALLLGADSFFNSRRDRFAALPSAGRPQAASIVRSTV